MWRGNPLCSESLRHPTGPPGDHRPSLRLQILHLSTSAQSLSPCKVMHVHHGDQGLFSRGSIFCLPRPIKKKKHDLTPRVFKELSWCLVAKSCPVLCELMDCSLPGSSIHGILQAATPEWVTTLFFRGSSPSHASCISGRFFSAESPGKPKELPINRILIV